MVEFLMADDKTLVAPALRAVGNILTGDDVQTQVGYVAKINGMVDHMISGWSNYNEGREGGEGT